MPGLTTFTDFMNATRQLKVTSTGDILNEATRNRYELSEMLRNRTADQMLKGGEKLVDFIQISDNGSYNNYGIADSQTPVNVDVIKKIEVGWKFSSVNFSWTDEYALLNYGDPDKFFDVIKQQEGSCVTAQVNGMEDSLWAPATVDMESSNGKTPYSIPAFINEYPNSLPPGFSTIMTIDPSTTKTWQCRQSGYTQSVAKMPSDDNGILRAMDRMKRQVQFDPIVFQAAKQYWENDDLRKMKIRTNGDGLDIYKMILRASNDRTVSPQDASYDTPTYAGYPVMNIDALDTAAIYTGVPLAASHTNGVANPGFPRYYFENYNYLYPVFNKYRYFEKTPVVDGGVNQPTRHAQYYFTFWNLWKASGRRHGIVYPSAA